MYIETCRNKPEVRHLSDDRNKNDLPKFFRSYVQVLIGINFVIFNYYSKDQT